jgi:hypothetical protein
MYLTSVSNTIIRSFDLNGSFIADLSHCDLHPDRLAGKPHQGTTHGVKDSVS